MQDSAARISQALDLHRQGRLEQAREIYSSVLESDPACVDALHFLGLIAHQQGDHAEAVKRIGEAIAAAPHLPYPHSNLGLALHALGRDAEALASYDRALAIKPDYAEALCNRGNSLAALGRPAEALASYDRALASRPGWAEAHYNRARALHTVARFADAVAAYDRALAIRSEYPEAWCDRGSALRELGRSDDALASFDRAVSLRPEYGEAWINRGIALRELGRLALALASYDRALAHAPESARAHFNRGNVLLDLGRRDEAVASYERALALKPDFEEAALNLALVLHGVGRRDEALAVYRRLLVARPDSVAARWSRVMAILPVVPGPGEDPGEARATFGRELDALAAWLAAGDRAADEAVGRTQPFYLAYQEEANRDLLATYGGLCARAMARWQQSRGLVPAPRVIASPLRIGIVSAHIREHSVWNAVVRGWLAHADRGKVEYHLFHVGAVEDEETQWAKTHAASYTHGRQGLEGWVRAILGAQPDVIVYPEIGMDPTTTRLASLRLARLQATAWGHPDTSGLPTMDYYFSGAAFEPEDAQRNYTETLVALPGLGCAITPMASSDAVLDREALGLDGDLPSFICPGTPYKYAPRDDDVLVAIARAVGPCRFVFFRHGVPELSDRLRQRLDAAFARGGLDFARFGRFVPWQSRPAFHALLRQSTVYLDTIGFSGFNTAVQAVECGLPLVTREGRFLRGRLASGVARTLEMPELVASDNAGYVALAAQLAADGARRARIRERYAAARHRLYGGVASIRALEDFLVAAAARGLRKSTHPGG